MSNIIYPNEGLLQLLSTAVSQNGNATRWSLFVNDIVPTKATVFADVVEASFTGYANHVVNDSDYGTQGLNGNTAFMIAAPITFSKTSGASVNVYGYFVTDTDQNELFQIFRFDDAPIVLPDGAASLSILPTWGDFSEEG